MYAINNVSHELKYKLVCLLSHVREMTFLVHLLCLYSMDDKGCHQIILFVSFKELIGFNILCFAMTLNLL
jgi:hypothetical protein